MKLDRDASLHAVKLRPTLILGLGRWGGQAVAELHRRLRLHFPEGLELPIWRSVWLSDEGVEAPAGVQRLSLSWNSMEEVLRQCQGPAWLHARKGWYPGWSSLAEEAAPSRPAGRLRFFWHFAQLRTVLSEALSALRDPQNPQKLLDSLPLRQRQMLAQVLLDQPTRVHVLASAGESLSGMLFDLGFWLRESSLAVGVERNLWLEVNPTGDLQQRSRACATLMEWQHFCTEHHGFVGEWEAQREVRPLATAFDQCYLSGPQSAGEVAELLMQELWMPDFVEQLRSQRRSMQAVGCLVATRVRVDRAHLSHGALRALGARRLARESMQSLLSSVAQDRTGWELLGDERNSRRSWLFRLLDPSGKATTRDPSTPTLVDDIYRWGRDTRRSLQRPLAEVVPLLQRILPQGRLWVEEELVPLVLRNREALLESELGRIRSQCHEAVERGGWGLEQVLEKLAGLRQDLERWGEQFRRHSTALIDLQREVSGRVARQLADLARLHLRPNWDGRRAILFRHFQDLLLELHQGTMDRPGLYVSLLLQAAHNEAASLCRELARRLEVGESGQVGQEFQLLAEQVRHQQSLLGGLEVPDDGFSGRLFDEIYARYAGDPAPLARQLLNDLGEGLQGCIQSDFRAHLLERCARPFARLEHDYSWYALYPRFREELQGRLGQQTGVDSNLRVLVLPAAPSGWGALEASQAEVARRGLLAGLEQRGLSGWQVVETGFSEQILAYSECTQPLEQLLELEPLRSAYLQESSQGAPLHIDARAFQDWPEIGSLSPAEREARDEAREAFVLGVLCGVLQAFDAGWVWQEVEGLETRVHPLGERRQLLTRLSRAGGLRSRLLATARRQLEQRLRPDLESQLQLARQIAAMKSECWALGGREAELHLLGQLEQRIQAGDCYRQHGPRFSQLLEARA